MPSTPALLTEKLQSTQGEKSSSVYLREVDSQTGNPLPEVRRFQFFPETLSDSKAINYQTKEIPGASLPLYQWINSGERVVNFQVYFTSDIDLLAADQSDIVARLKAAGASRYNVDIRAAIVWLRRFMLPAYEDGSGTSGVGVPLTFSPSRVQIIIPNSGIGLAGGDAGMGDPDTVECVMTQCEVTYEAMFPSGLPRVVSVNLSFVQIAQRLGFVFFPRRGDIMGKKGPMEEAVTNPAAPFFGYNFVTKAA